MNNEIIFRMLNILDEIGAYLGINYDEDNKYNSMWLNFRKISKDTNNYFVDNFPSDLRFTIESFIYDDKIEYMNKNIFQFLHPGEDYFKADEKYLNQLKLSNLSNRQLMQYFSLIVGTISLVQKDNLLLLKYSKSIFNTGWHQVAINCRGKVINMNTMKIVAYPFDKFFNLGEIPENSVENLEDKVRSTSNITVTDKKDGSLIIVTRLNENEEPLINTNGSFDNLQIDVARRYFKEKYPDFYNNMKCGYTYMFELITPEDPHIIKYNDTEKLYLLATRNLSDYSLLSYSDLKSMAGKYHLDITESYQFTNIKDFMKEATKSGACREGWVFRLTDEKNNDYMFKLKFDEYFLLHRAASSISIQKVYKLLVGGNLDEKLTQCSSNLQEDIISLIEEINIIKSKAADYVVDTADTLLFVNHFTYSDFQPENMEEDKPEKVKLIQDTIKSSIYGPSIISYIKNQDKSRLFNHTTPKFFDVLLSDFDVKAENKSLDSLISSFDSCENTSNICNENIEER